MTVNNRCYGCMAAIVNSSICPSCGSQHGSEPDNPLYLPPGYILNNRYLIGKVIGVGGFGIVYIGWDNNLEIKVAVKEFLPKEYAARASDHVSILPYTGSAKDEFTIGAEKFLDEAKALAKFQDHPGIVTVYESFRTNNTAYMVMQHLDGMTLKEYLKKQPGEKIAFNLAVKAMIPIMDALKEVHRAGFVHRDISPDNIFITRQNQIKLLDFGAARYAIGEHSKSLTSVLKHGYAPVEQYSSKGNQGPWSDVYAVAATIYRCVTGQIPTDAMERIQEDTIKSPKQLNVDITLNAELAIMKGLALKAADRYVTVSDFQNALLGDASSVDATIGDKIIAPQPANVTRQARSGTAKPSLSPQARDYGDDAPNYRLLGLKIAGGIFVLLLIVANLSSKKKEEAPAPAPPPAPTATSIAQEPIPERATTLVTPTHQEKISPPQPSYTPPSAVAAEPNIGRFKHLANSVSGEKYYYDAESYRRYSNNMVRALTVISNKYGNLDNVQDIKVDCNSAIVSVDGGNYFSIPSGSVGEAIYAKLCNR